MKFRTDPRTQIVTWDPTDKQLTEKEAQIVNAAQTAYRLKEVAEALQAIAAAIRARF